MSKIYNKETDEQQKLRFQIELEFVQCLANPNYLNFLAQRGYLNNKAFINYLNYLKYWKNPEYSKFLKYPMCLHFLDLLQYDHFRKEITNSQCAKFIEDQQLLHWQHYIRKRTRLLQAANSNQENQNSASTNSNFLGSNESLNSLSNTNHINNFSSQVNL